MTGVIDENNARYSSTTYDAEGHATETYLAAGVDRFSAAYEPSSDATYFSGATVTEPLGSTETLTFTTAWNRASENTKSITCAGCVTSVVQTTFDANGRVDTSSDNGEVVDFDYNARGLQTQGIEAANDTSGNKRTVQTDWDAVFAVPTERRAYDAAATLVAKQAWTYNSRGQVLTATRTDPVTAAAAATTTAYCEQGDVDAGTCPLIGLVRSIDGPRVDVSDVTTYTYYASDDASCATAPTICPHRRGDLWKVTNALGQVTETLAYDGAGRVLSVKDANGVVTDMTYTSRGWLTARKVRGPDNTVETDDAITRIDYWPTGLVKQVTQPDGSYTAYGYDAAHRLTDVSDSAGNAIHYTLDNAGNRTGEDTRDPSGTLTRTLSRVYNQLGQLQSQRDAASHATTFTYDANGNSDLVTDAASHVTDNDYDPLNRLSRTLQDVGGIAANTQFQYDALDNLTQVTDPDGLVTGYGYDSLGNLTSLSSPDTGATSYAYDSAGNRKTQTDARSKVTTYSYDALNRLTAQTYATASINVTLSYDTVNAVCAAGETFAIGRLTKLTMGNGNSTQYCYDRFGSPVRKVETINGKAFTLRYGYNLAGRLITLTYPDGVFVDYVRNSNGQITEVGVTQPGSTRQVLLTGAIYYPFGPPKQWTFGNGRVLHRTHDLDYRPWSISDTASGGLSLGYTFNAVGNLAELRDAGQAGPPQMTFGYDGLNRLTDFLDGPTGATIEHYAYNATGDRTLFQNSAGTQAYIYLAGTHRLRKVGDVYRWYDAAGNTTSIGGNAQEYSYNAAGRMENARQNNVVVMNYRYNGKGERVHQFLTTTGTTQTYTVYDEAGHWIGDYDSTGATIQQAIWLDDLSVGLLAGASTSQKLDYVEADALGTPRAVIDPARNVAIWSWDLKSEAFGNSPPNQDPDGDSSTFVFNLRFPGQQYDSAANLNYNYLRDYDSISGRYLESDPIGIKSGISTFVYVDASPLSNVDPTGLMSQSGPKDDFSRLAALAKSSAFAKLQKCNLGECENNRYSISPSERSRIMATVLSAEVYFEPRSTNCGLSDPQQRPNEIGLGAALFSNRGCCPMDAVIAHEAAHLVFGEPLYSNWATEVEGKARYLQRQCFGCSSAFE